MMRGFMKESAHAARKTLSGRDIQRVHSIKEDFGQQHRSDVRQFRLSVRFPHPDRLYLGNERQLSLRHAANAFLTIRPRMARCRTQQAHRHGRKSSGAPAGETARSPEGWKPQSIEARPP